MITPRDVQGDLGIEHKIPNVKKEGEARQKSLRSGYKTPNSNLFQGKEDEVGVKVGKKKFTCACVCVLVCHVNLSLSSTMYIADANHHFLLPVIIWCFIPRLFALRERYLNYFSALSFFNPSGSDFVGSPA